MCLKNYKAASVVALLAKGRVAHDDIRAVEGDHAEGSCRLL